MITYIADVGREVELVRQLADTDILAGLDSCMRDISYYGLETVKA